MKRYTRHKLLPRSGGRTGEESLLVACWLEMGLFMNFYNDFDFQNVSVSLELLKTRNQTNVA